MHHATAARASRFGVHNDPAITIAWLLGHGPEHLAYVDIDAHHGDGLQTAFYPDPGNASGGRSPRRPSS